MTKIEFKKAETKAALAVIRQINKEIDELEERTDRYNIQISNLKKQIKDFAPDNEKQIKDIHLLARELQDIEAWYISDCLRLQMHKDNVDLMEASIEMQDFNY